jgi:hypothetical protein
MTQKPFSVFLACDALDQPRQHLAMGWMGLRLHGARRLARDYAKD